MQKLGGLIVIGFLKFFSKLPISLLYILSDCVAFLSNNIFKYRKDVIVTNLKNSFPEKNSKEIEQLTLEFYRYLSDLVVESLKAFNYSPDQIKERVHFQNLDIFLPYANRNEPVIVTIGHYANWEIVGVAGGAISEVNFYSLYRTLKNKAVSEFVVSNRERLGLQLIEEKQAIKQIPSILKEEKPNVLVFLADQAIAPKRAHWVTFLNQETTFAKGPELYAKKYDCPVFFAAISRVKRGYYSVKFHLITDTPKETKSGEITETYAHLLEKEIRKEIPIWLWSHRRWKHKRNNS